MTVEASVCVAVSYRSLLRVHGPISDRLEKGGHCAEQTVLHVPRWEEITGQCSTRLRLHHDCHVDYWDSTPTTVRNRLLEPTDDINIA